MDVDSIDSEVSETRTASDEIKDWYPGNVQWIHNGTLIYELEKISIVLTRTIYGSAAKCTAYLDFTTKSHGYQNPMGGIWPEPTIVFLRRTPEGNTELHRIKFDRTSVDCRPRQHTFSAPVPVDLFPIISHAKIPPLRSSFEKC